MQKFSSFVLAQRQESISPSPLPFSTLGAGGGMLFGLAEEQATLAANLRKGILLTTYCHCLPPLLLTHPCNKPTKPTIARSGSQLWDRGNASEDAPLKQQQQQLEWFNRREKGGGETLALTGDFL